MASITGTPVWVEGTLSAGNIRAGRFFLECIPDNLITTNVWGDTVPVPDMAGTGLIHAFVTPHTTKPSGTKDSDPNTVQQVSVCNETATSFDIRMHRTSSPDPVSTWIFWFAIRTP